MIWYYVILALLVYPMLYAYIGYIRDVDMRNVILVISIGLLTIFMSCRADSVGADTCQYTWGFERIADVPWSRLLTTKIYGMWGGYELNFEYGYRVYNKLVSVISEHSQAIIISNGILIMILLGMLIKGYSPYVFLSIWLYVTLGVYQTQMNMARNAIAIFICYNGIKYIENRDLKKYLICICIATTFHVSSVLFIPVYWLAAIRLTDKKIWVIIAFLCSVGFLFSLIRQIIVQFLPFGFGRYFIGNTTKFESLVVGAFHLMLVLFIFFFTERQKRADIFETEAVGIWMLIIEILFFCIGYDVASAARMAALFGPYLIVFVPRLIETGIGSKDERLNVIAMVTILSGIQYIVRLQMNNIGATIPYKFFWS